MPLWENHRWECTLVRKLLSYGLWRVWLLGRKEVFLLWYSEHWQFQKMTLKALYKDNKYPSHGVIKEFVKLNNLRGAAVKQILENLMKLNFHVVLKLKRINLVTSVYLHVVLILFFFAQYVCSHEMISMSNGENQWLLQTIHEQKFCGPSISHRLLIDHGQ